MTTYKRNIGKMVRLPILILASYIVPTLLLYIAFAYGNWNMNPATWPDPCRGFHISFSLAVGTLVSIMLVVTSLDD